MTNIYLVRFIPTDRNADTSPIGAYASFDDARAAIVADCYAYGHHHRRYGENDEANAYGIAADEIGRPNVTERWYNIIVHGDNPRTIGAYHVTEWRHGQRVRLSADVETYPIYVNAGNTGTITLLGTSDVGIMLDTPHDDLAEWDNVLHVWVTDSDVDYTDSVAAIPDTDTPDTCSTCGTRDDLHRHGDDVRCHPCRLDDDLRNAGITLRNAASAALRP